MLDKQTLKELGRFTVTGGVKMFLEAPYNELFKTEFGQRLKQLGITSQVGIVSALGLLTFFLQKKLPADTAFQSVVKEIAADSWPEISKRLFNGFTDFLVSRSESAEPLEKEVIDRLRQVKPEDLEKLLADLGKINEEQNSAALDDFTQKIRGSRKRLQEKRKGGLLW